MYKLCHGAVEFWNQTSFEFGCNMNDFGYKVVD